MSIKHFSIHEQSTDSELLQTLITHPQYADHYAGGEVADQGGHNLHGPYELARIDVSTFVRADGTHALSVIQSWLSDLHPLDGGAEDALQKRVLPLMETVTYQLPDIRTTAEHEWGWVVGTGGFHEFVAIDRQRASLDLIVCSDD